METCLPENNPFVVVVKTSEELKTIHKEQSMLEVAFCEGFDVPIEIEHILQRIILS